ncbi:universal stress protein [Corynebacterium vitaeruminis]|uniref:Universal stress protein n=1 Tax=Corynebacterium vitaeruminis DSM 20294 TaxID=1224164 RepID=W5Y4X9_9CORY|nr:universal stress protein [Corynebacterium vitaeruminis]AHI23890.1 universal stress protein [Corynebacterium vitaeruminis DSM 20294]
MTKKSSTDDSPDHAADPIHVLVVWSPNEGGNEAIQVAAWLARTTPVEIRCVTTFLRPWPSPSISKLGDKYKRWFKKEASRLEKVVRSELSKEGLDSEQLNKRVSIFADGSNEAALLAEAAADYHADVILLGSNATAPKGRFLPSTTADTLLHSSPIPLGLAPRSPKLSKRGITRINYAHVSDEDPSKDLHRVALLARQWDVPLRIVALSPSGFGQAPISQSLELPSDLTLEWRENTLAILDRLSDSLHDEFPEVFVETEVASGSGWAGALDAVKWKKGDLLCLRSTPMRAIERVFVGSQAAEILPHVRVPVLMLQAAAS